MRRGIIALLVVCVINLAGAWRNWGMDWGWVAINLLLAIWTLGSILAPALGAHAKRGDRVEPDREAGQ
jgi:hypothetical protein